jgi:hypothetical protein
MHNLALFSMLDFQGFDEARFWKEHEALVHRFGTDMAHYRYMFDRELAEQMNKSATPPPLMSILDEG